jgi:predicted Zn-dependent protease
MLAERGQVAWLFKGRIAEAKDVLLRDDRKAAGVIFDDLRLRFPSRAAASAEFLQIGLDLGRFEDLEALLATFSKVDHRNPMYEVGLARVAQGRGDTEIAIERWAEVRRKQPGLPLGYSQGAATLTQCQRTDEAQKILAEGIRRVPGDLICRLEYAKLAEAQRQDDEAVIRWHAVRATQPGTNSLAFQLGSAGLGRCLRRIGKFDEAEDLLGDVSRRYPQDIGAAMEFARVAEDRGDLPEAGQRWKQVVRRFPLKPFGYLNLARILDHEARAEEADLVALDGILRLPDNPELLVRYAEFATSRKHFAEAARRWEMLRERFPDRIDGYSRGADALAACGRTEEAAVLRAGQTPPQTLASP